MLSKKAYLLIGVTVLLAVVFIVVNHNYFAKKWSNLTQLKTGEGAYQCMNCFLHGSAHASRGWFIGPSQEGDRVCVTTAELEPIFIQCHPEVVPASRLAPGTDFIQTDSLPQKSKLLPEIGNGHLATVVRSDTIYMNGLYNGANIKSHRARIPSTAAVLVSVISPQRSGPSQFRLDMGRGVFTELITGDGFTVEVHRYAHRELTRLMVVEAVVKRKTSSLPIVLTFNLTVGPPSEDIDVLQEKPGLWRGRTKEAEYPKLTSTTPVAVRYTIVPPNITFAANKQGSVVFFTAVSTSVEEAERYYAEGVSRLKEGRLFSSHVGLWSKLWSRGQVQLAGNVTLALTTNAAFYYLLTALPLKANDSWPFCGMSPGGLAHGKMDDYGGHIFWDQDMWMFPPIALLHADLARLIVGTRLRTYSAAKLYASQSGLQGVRYPWESAFTGLNTSPSKETTEYEIHVTGDVAWMIRQYLQLTNDTVFLKQDGYSLLSDIADFWVSRSYHNPEKGAYEIKGVMGPDEHHYPVNNSVYTNVIAVLSARTAQFAASLIGVTPSPQWEIMSSAMYIPFNSKFMYHPEFDTYSRDTDVKQADVIMLGYPLNWNMTDTIHLNDLTYYDSVTPGGPAMTWGISAINWLRLDQKDKADSAFLKGIKNVQSPFKVWSENADGTGAYNFHTGMGGFLQSLLFGYLGADLDNTHLDFNPQLPPTTTAMMVVGLDYLGSWLDVTFDEGQLNVTLTKVKIGEVLQLVFLSEKRTVKLVVGVHVTGRRQPVRIQPLSSEPVFPQAR